jgi:TPR repeat protein
MHRKTIYPKLLALLAMCMLYSFPSFANAFDDGLSAYNAGNFSEATNHFKKAAELGHAGAQYNLGLMYNDGQGVTQDRKEAAKWFQKAAEQGFAKAQDILGLMYSNGKVVPRDYVQAYLWFHLAGMNGEPDSTVSRDIIASMMTPSQTEQAQELAREWKPKKP